MREKYEIDWCQLCDTAVISCGQPGCDGTTCNGTGCQICSADQDYQDFYTAKTRVTAYLTEEEKQTYYKIRQLQKFILKSLSRGELKIDFKALKESGRLSENDKGLFKKELE